MTGVPARRGIAPGLQNAARFVLFLVERPSLAGAGFVIAIALLGLAGVNFYTWLSQPPALGPGQYLPPVAPTGPVATAPAPGQPSVVLQPRRVPSPQSPLLQAEAISELDGIAPPPAYKPIPEAPFGVVRGYRPSLGPAPYRP